MFQIFNHSEAIAKQRQDIAENHRKKRIILKRPTFRCNYSRNQKKIVILQPKPLYYIVAFFK